MSKTRVFEVSGEYYGGLAKTADPDVRPAFVLRNEKIEVSADGTLLQILEPAAERVQPACPHFEACGGCQYQMTDANEQGDIKRRVLLNELHGAGIDFPTEIPVHLAQGYGYRNRIRLRVERVGEVLRFGYNERGSTRFLAIEECPIAASVLWETAEALLRAAARDEDVAYWLSSASDVELFANETLERVQVTLSVAPRTKAKQGSIVRALAAMQVDAPKIVGVGVLAVDPRIGPTGKTVAEAGAAGLVYRVLDEAYWIARGGFFQVNRFLLPTLVELVTRERRGGLAWDLFAGVGLFSRVLARSFDSVVAVESNARATADNQAALKKIGPQHQAVAMTTVEFLRVAVTQRERPELVVMDPPRAGAGVEACELLNRVGAPSMVYVSCDPVTLARDLAALRAKYEVRALHLVDLFPQTFHMETVVMLERRS